MDSRERRPGLRAHPLWQLTHARLVEFVREPGALFWVFVFPVLLAVGLGIAFRARPEEKTRVVVARSVTGAERLAHALRARPDLSVRVLPLVRARADLRRGRADLVVGPGAGAGSRPGYTLYFDPARAEARLARASVAAAIQRYHGQAEVATLHEATAPEQAGRYIDFLIPGLLGLNLMGSGMWGIGFVVVQNRTRKLLKRFAATPMRRSHYLLSFMLSRLLFLVLEVGALLLAGRLLFGVRVYGSLLGVGVVSIVGALSFSGLAMLVAARPRSIEAASGWMNLVMLPMWLLSGSFFSVERFPEAALPFIRALPLTALNDALRLVINEGRPLHACGLQLAVLAGWGLVSFAIALRIFRWR